MAVAHGAPKVEFTGVTTILDGEPVLHRLHLEVPAGRTTVILGRSGSGRTTLVKHLVGQLEPTRGSVRIDGREVSSTTRAAAGRHPIAAVVGGATLFNSQLFSSMTVQENVTWVAQHGELAEDQTRATMTVLFGQLGLADVAHCYPEEISAHARRRVLIARVLASGMSLMVIDDIGHSFDFEYTEAVVAAIKSVSASFRPTVLLTTTDVGCARAVADHVAVLFNGEIVSHGQPDVLLRGIENDDDFARRFCDRSLVAIPLSEVDEEQVREETDRKVLFQLDTDVAIWCVVLLGLLIIALVLWSLVHVGSGSP